MQAEFLCEFFRICKEEGIHTCLDTSGAIFNERTKAVIDYISHYNCIERVELLSYHIMGEAKYKKLNIPYPLEGIPPLQSDRLEEIREMFRKKLNIKVL